MEKPYFYCLECGYVGTKENSHLCTHNKFKQLDTIEVQTATCVTNDRILLWEGLRKYIYQMSRFESTVFINKDDELSVICKLTKFVSSKPKRTTIEMIRNLVQYGIKLYFIDPENYTDDDSKYLRVLNEIASRCKALYTYDDKAKIDIKAVITSEDDDITALIPVLPTEFWSLTDEEADSIAQSAVNLDKTSLYVFTRNHSGWLKVSHNFKLI